MSILDGLAFLELSGIRTAAERKKSAPPRIPIATALIFKAAQSIRKIFPQIQRLHLVGSRLRHKYGRDLDFVAVVDSVGDMPSRNILDLSYGGFKINLFFATPEEAETTILEFGLGFDIMRWKRAAIAKGLKLNRFGLWKDSRVVTRKMAEIAAVLGMPLKPFLVMTLRNPL